MLMLTRWKSAARVGVQMQVSTLLFIISNVHWAQLTLFYLPHIQDEMQRGKQVTETVHYLVAFVLFGFFPCFE